MKSKSLQSIAGVGNQELQIYASSPQKLITFDQTPYPTQQQPKVHKQQQQILHSQAPTTTIQSQNRLYQLADEKINDVIFIEETPKLRIITTKKILHESNESISKFSNHNTRTSILTTTAIPTTITSITAAASNDLNNNSTHHYQYHQHHIYNNNSNNEMKYMTSSNQIYPDQSSLFTIQSTTASNLALRTLPLSAQQQLQINTQSNNTGLTRNHLSKSSKLVSKSISLNTATMTKFQQQQQQQQQQQTQPSFLLNTTKSINMIERSSSNKYTTLHSSSSTRNNNNTTSNNNNNNNNNNSQLANDIKKYVPGRTIINQGSPTPSIISVAKPIISNVFISSNASPVAANNNISSNNGIVNYSNNNANLIINNGSKPVMTSSSITRINKSGIIRTNERSPTSLLSPIITQQQTPTSAQQQNFYTITTSNSINNNNNSTTATNTQIPIVYDTTQSQQLIGKTSFKLANNDTQRNKSPIIMTREKTNLTSYFTNIINQTNNAANNSVNVKKFNNVKQINGSLTNNLINKLNISRNELNSSLSSNHNGSSNNINNMLINATGGASLSKPNTAKYSNSFSYKFNVGTSTNGSVATPSTPNRYHHQHHIHNQYGTVENDFITGVSLKSSGALRNKFNSSNSLNELMHATNLTRNDSRLLDSVIQEIQDDNESLNENLVSNIEDGHNEQHYLLQNKLINKRATINSTKSRPLVKQLTMSNVSNNNTNNSNIANNSYQQLQITNSKKQFYTIDDTMNANNVTNNPHFDESLHFDNTNGENGDENFKIKYRNNSTNNLARNSKSSFKETSTKMFGSIIMPSKSTLITNNNQNGGGTPSQNKRHDSAKSYISRDINDSYAYNDVKKYIEENDLMPPDRAEFIKLWIRDVNMCLKDLEQTVI